MKVLILTITTGEGHNQVAKNLKRCLFDCGTDAYSMDVLEYINGVEAIVNLLSFTGKRCPHLGCALKWNPAEHSWDCPCHGSRFATDGRVLDNPAHGK